MTDLRTLTAAAILAIATISAPAAASGLDEG